MIPHAGRGSSFKGLSAYLLNNTAEQAPDEPNRVAWAETENLAGLDADYAWKVMARTAQSAEALKLAAGVPMTGAKSTGRPVYHFSLSWAQDESPDDDHMRQSAREAVAVLGLHEHQWMMVRHTDKEHDHVHIMVNLVHGETGKTASLKFDHTRLSSYAARYEREHGIKCPLRLENAERRKQGENTKHQDEKRDYAAQVTKLWQRSDSGAAFVHALDGAGLQLAQGTRKNRLVIVDDRGDIQALDRQLDIQAKGRAKGKAIREKVGGLELPNAEKLSQQIKAEREHSREAQDGDAQAKMLAAADAQAAKIEAAERTRAEDKARAAAHAEHLAKVELRQGKERDELQTRLDQTFAARLDKLEAETEKFAAYVEGRGVMLALRRVWRGEKDRELLAEFKREKAEIDSQCSKAWISLIQIHTKEMQDLELVYEAKKQRFAALDAEKQVEVLRRLDERRATAKPKGKAGQLAPATKKRGIQPHISTMERQRQERLQKRVDAIRWRQQEADQKRLTDAKMIADRAKADARAAEIAAQGQPDTARSDRLAKRIDSIKKSENRRDKGRDFTPE